MITKVNNDRFGGAADPSLSNTRALRGVGVEPSEGSAGDYSDMLPPKRSTVFTRSR